MRPGLCRGVIKTWIGILGQFIKPSLYLCYGIIVYYFEQVLKMVDLQALEL